MALPIIDQNRCIRCDACITACPFGAIIEVAGSLQINDNCRLCRLCIKQCPVSAISLTTESAPTQADRQDWQGILVYAELTAGEVHPVTIELIGEATRLAQRVPHPISVLLVGKEVGRWADELLRYGVDQVFCYDYPELEHFRVDTYANAFADCIRNAKPAVVLVGATSIGRSLAPRVAARFRTGLTADCTQLELRDNGDLVQIRPAFGGNIMAQIVTPHSRPQFATVRYKVMNPAQPVDCVRGTAVHCALQPGQLQSQVEIVSCQPREKSLSITDADVLVVAGKGLKDSKGLSLLQELADLLGGQVAATRAVVEAGWLEHQRQIGLSGRTVKPKLIITCGVSGAVQFTAGMQGADCIVAINKDPAAPIFKVAHYGLVGDLYEVLPALLAKLKGGLPK
ncbi:MAG: FAD-binding protein [Bacillota bacterium]|jgi:electron transfer flavoprotein alpha subunit